MGFGSRLGWFCLTLAAVKLPSLLIVEWFLLKDSVVTLDLVVLSAVAIPLGCFGLRNQPFLLASYVLNYLMVLVLSIGRVAHALEFAASEMTKEMETTQLSQMNTEKDEVELTTAAGQSAGSPSELTAGDNVSSKMHINDENDHQQQSEDNEETRPLTSVPGAQPSRLDAIISRGIITKKLMVLDRRITTMTIQSDITTQDDWILSLNNPWYTDTLKESELALKWRGDWVYSCLYLLFLLYLCLQTLMGFVHFGSFINNGNDHGFFYALGIANLIVILSVPLPVGIYRCLCFAQSGDIHEQSQTIDATRRPWNRDYQWVFQVYQESTKERENNDECETSESMLMSEQSNSWCHATCVNGNGKDSLKLRSDLMVQNAMLISPNAWLINAHLWCVLISVILIFCVRSSLDEYGGLFVSLELIPLGYAAMCQAYYNNRHRQQRRRIEHDNPDGIHHGWDTDHLSSLMILSDSPNLIDCYFWAVWFEFRLYLIWMFFTLDSLSLNRISGLYRNGDIPHSNLTENGGSHSVQFFITGCVMISLTAISAAYYCRRLSSD